MKITLKNLGTIKQADLTFGDLTIICGKNNTGKTYVTYAIYGFLDFWHNGLSIDIPQQIVSDVMHKGSIAVSVDTFADQAEAILKSASQQFSTMIGGVFAGKEGRFDKSRLSVEVEKDQDYNTNAISFTAGSVGRSLLEVKKIKGDNKLIISLLIDKNAEDLPPRAFIENMISTAVRDLIFKNKMPNPFIISAERTGSAIFQKELDFNRNRLINLISDKDAKLNPVQLLGAFSAEYPLPIRRSVDFIRDLPNILNRKSIFSEQHPEILQQFSRIIGGKYHVSKDAGIQFIPHGKRITLSLVESSSAVRSLLDIGFYLHHIAQPGDMMIIDEPELNLHPENQRKMARLFASMANCGVKVFITTHSDYIIKELNTLILLNKSDRRLEALAQREGYSPLELLSCDKLKVYVAKIAPSKDGGKKRKSRCETLVPATISDEAGIVLDSFDDTIEEMNRIQEEIIWG